MGRRKKSVVCDRAGDGRHVCSSLEKRWKVGILDSNPALIFRIESFFDICCVYRTNNLLVNILLTQFIKRFRYLQLIKSPNVTNVKRFNFK